MKNYTYVISEDNVTVFYDGVPHVFNGDSPKATKLIEAIKNKVSDEEMKTLLESDCVKEYASNICAEGVVITDDEIYLDGEVIDDELALQIRKYFNLRLPFAPLCNFVKKLRENPSFKIRKQLWGFIKASEEAGGFSIADDGDILAYKRVSDDYKDIYTGKFDNSIGSIVEMPRRDVDDDPNNTCSVGLHFCAYSYLESYANNVGRIVLVKVNPADVVSIPTDYGFAKARCCRYEVIRDINEVLSKPAYNVNESCISPVKETDNDKLEIENTVEIENMNFAVNSFINHCTKDELTRCYRYLSDNNSIRFMTKNEAKEKFMNDFFAEYYETKDIEDFYDFVDRLYEIVENKI